MKIESVDLFYLAMPTVLDIGDGSQDMLLVRVQADGHVGWGECEASPLVSIASLVAPMSHSACHPVLESVAGQDLSTSEDISRISRLIRCRAGGSRPFVGSSRMSSFGPCAMACASLASCFIPSEYVPSLRYRASPSPT